MTSEIKRKFIIGEGDNYNVYIRLSEEYKSQEKMTAGICAAHRAFIVLLNKESGKKLEYPITTEDFEAMLTLGASLKDLPIEKQKLEIEKKYLIKPITEELKNSAYVVKEIKQSYLAESDAYVVRIRSSNEFESENARKMGVCKKSNAYLTIKQKIGGIARQEYEFDIPVGDADFLIENEKTVVEKNRYCLKSKENLVWELDEFKGKNKGLYTGEIEIPTVETPFEVPDYVIKDVTEEKEYSNHSLSYNPFESWSNSSNSKKKYKK